MLVLGFSLALAIVLLLCQGELALSGVVPAPGATRRRIGKGPGSANVFEPQEGPLQSFGRTQPHNHPPVSWFPDEVGGRRGTGVRVGRCALEEGFVQMPKTSCSPA